MQWKIPNTKEQINELKGFAGVYSYLYKGKPLYIGKSTHVKARLLSHLENAKVSRKEAIYVNKADTLELYQTDSELNALLLESKLIQTHHPRYNVRWMDNKSYLYIKVTVKEKFPKLFAVRREVQKNALYFGPFASKEVVDSLLRILRKVFPFCTQQKITKRPCFYSKIGLCNPCPNVITTPEETRQYRRNIRKVISVLNGNSGDLQKYLSDQIKKESEVQNYEQALKYRNILHQTEHIYSHRLFDQDNNGLFNRSELMIGKLLKLLHHYFPAVAKLQRIECYDISNLSQQNPTASMVVFIDGQMTKSEYRKFKIYKTGARGDFAMLDETISRRLKNKWALPDLIILDGGKPQLRQILRLQAKDEKLKAIPVIGIAKNPDRLVMGTGDLPTIRLRLNDPALNLVQHMRDEAHRFAKKYHTLLRTKASMNAVKA